MSNFQYLLLEKVGKTQPVKEIFRKLDTLLDTKTNYVDAAKTLYENERRLIKLIESDLGDSEKIDFNKNMLRVLLAYTFRFFIGSSRGEVSSCLERSEKDATDLFVKTYAERYNLPYHETEKILRTLFHPVCNHTSEYPDNKIPNNNISKKAKIYTDLFLGNSILKEREKIQKIHEIDYKDENSIGKYNEITKKLISEIAKNHMNIFTKLKILTKTLYSEIDLSHKKNLEKEQSNILMEMALNWYEKDFLQYYMRIKDHSIKNLLSIAYKSSH